MQLLHHALWIIPLSDSRNVLDIIFTVSSQDLLGRASIISENVREMNHLRLGTRGEVGQESLHGVGYR